MILEQKIINPNSNIINSNERIEYLELHITILREHMEEYGKATRPEALELMEYQINILERELKIRKDFQGFSHK